MILLPSPPSIFHEIKNKTKQEKNGINFSSPTFHIFPFFPTFALDAKPFPFLTKLWVIIDYVLFR